jgi:hypothetical protein
MENPIAKLPGVHGNTVITAIISTLVVIAIIKYTASKWPSIPVLPTVASHI